MAASLHGGVDDVQPSLGSVLVLVNCKEGLRVQDTQQHLFARGQYV